MIENVLIEGIKNVPELVVFWLLVQGFQKQTKALIEGEIKKNTAALEKNSTVLSQCPLMHQQ